jgi:hypothetical protein
MSTTRMVKKKSASEGSLRPTASRKENIPPPPHRNGRGPRRFRFTYEDYARLFRVKVDTVRHWVCAGKLDPERLESIVDVWVKQRTAET